MLNRESFSKCLAVMQSTDSSENQQNIVLFSILFAACGKTLTESSGNFSFLTSKVPRLRPTTCAWRIFWTAGEKLHLRFKYVKFKFACKRSYIEIREGKHLNSPLVGRYCKSNPPPASIDLSNSNLWLKFHYGYKYYLSPRESVGFIAEYEGEPLLRVIRQKSSYVKP